MKTNMHKKIEVIAKKPTIIEYNKHSVVLINPNKPNWIKTSSSGSWIFSLLKKGHFTLDELIIHAAKHYSLPKKALEESIISLITKLTEYNFVRFVDQSKKNQGVHSEKKASSDELPEYGLTSLWFSILSQCNLKCKHCFKPDGKTTKPIPLEKAKYILEETSKLKIKRLYISGGEPLIHPDLLKIVKIAKDVSDWDIILISNGFTDNYKLVKKLSGLLHCYQFSIDGLDEKTNDSIRGKNSFRKVINLIEYLYTIKSDAKISISFTPHPNNIDQIPDLYKFALSLNADTIFLTKPKRSLKFNKKKESFFEEFLSVDFRERVFSNYDKLVKNYLKHRRGVSTFKNVKVPIVESTFDPCFNLLFPVKRACCGAGGNQLFINEEGDCYPCVALAKQENFLGNIFEQPIKKIYEVEAVTKFRQSIHVDKIEECKECPFKYICAGDCRALAKNAKDKTPYCELVKSRYHRFLDSVTV